MGDEVKRSLKVQFSSTGQAKLKADVDAVDKSMVKAGKDGNAAFKAAEGGITGLSKKMASALEPVDKAFAGFERLNGILGKAGMAGGLIMLGVELVAAGKELAGLNEQMKLNAARVEEQKRRYNEIADAVKTYAGRLREVNILEYIQQNKTLAKELQAHTSWLERKEKLEKRAAELLKDSDALYVRLQRSKQADVDASEGMSQQTWLLQKALDATNAEASRVDQNLITLRHTVDRSAESVDGAKRRLDDLVESMSGGAPKATSFAAAVDEVALALAQIDSGPTARAFDRLFEMTRGAQVDAMARLAGQWDDYAEAVWRGGHATRDAADAMRDAFAAGEAMTTTFESSLGLIDAHGQALASMAYEAVIAGQSFEEFLNAVARRAVGEAAIEAALYGAKALASLGVALFTGSPAALAAAETFGAAAAAFAAVATVAGAVAGATGGLVPATGGAGGAGGSAGLTGAQPVSGPTTVNVNFTGPTSGIGRFLADELNSEGRRQGGARLDSRVVR
jgi:hypothetical protein